MHRQGAQRRLVASSGMGASTSMRWARRRRGRNGGASSCTTSLLLPGRGRCCRSRPPRPRRRSISRHPALRSPSKRSRHRRRRQHDAVLLLMNTPDSDADAHYESGTKPSNTTNVISASWRHDTGPWPPSSSIHQGVSFFDSAARRREAQAQRRTHRQAGRPPRRRSRRGDAARAPCSAHHGDAGCAAARLRAISVKGQPIAPSRCARIDHASWSTRGAAGSWASSDLIRLGRR